MKITQKISPCLWFDDQAEEAAGFYTSVFKNARIKHITRYGEAGHEVHGRPAGSVMTVVFDLDGQEITALNGGPHFKFNEAVSLQVFCETQEEVDYYWEKLSEGGDEKAQVCGWLKDKYGLSWQVIPIYCIPATRAPIVAVFRRGPARWSHVGRWDLGERRYEIGGWLGGKIFPRRSDLSPDGRFLCYFVHKPSATWEHREAYVALSKLPWLTALHAFCTCGTWTRGYYFTEDKDCEYRGDEELPIPYGLRSNPIVQFANERCRGWEEAKDSPQRDAMDVWDQRRNARIQKRQPGGDRLLCVESRGQAGGEFGVNQAVDGMRVGY